MFSNREQRPVQQRKPTAATTSGEGLEERWETGATRGSAGDASGPGGRSNLDLFGPDERQQVARSAQQHKDKLLHDQLTAQIKSGLAAKPTKGDRVLVEAEPDSRRRSIR